MTENKGDASSLPYLELLGRAGQAFYQQATATAHLSWQEKHTLLTMLADWQIAQTAVPPFPAEDFFGHADRGQRAAKLMAYCRQYYQQWQTGLPAPLGGGLGKALPAARPILAEQALRLGHCPVNSPQTRCCQLYTLDVVRGCALGCHYCSLQTFSHAQEILVTDHLAEKLEALPLPSSPVHIGTGQAADSLALGNQFNLLRDLLAWAARHRQVILELKTKSAQVDDLLALQAQGLVPPNVLVAWSLNPPAVAGEEPRAASVAQRLQAAQRVAAAGIWVGFHWHPMIYYQGWRADYAALAGELQRRFDPAQVMMVSFGTLTYTKKVMAQIRQNMLQTQQSSKVLQIPWAACGSKFSYPLAIKREMFAFAYQCFSAWHKQVYFYLCMEDASLSPLVGHAYQSNEEFCQDLTQTYARRMAERLKNASKKI